jgi:hypothetical protein
LSKHESSPTKHEQGSSPFYPLSLRPYPLKIPLADPGHTDTSTFRELSKRGKYHGTPGLWMRPSRTILSSRMEPNGKCAFSVHAHPRRSLGKRDRSLFQDGFFQNCPLLDSNPLPGPPRLIPEKECEYTETVLALTLKDRSNLKYPKNSLSGIGHIAKIPQILYWAQLWFGLGDHEPRARITGT